MCNKIHSLPTERIDRKTFFLPLQNFSPFFLSIRILWCVYGHLLFILLLSVICIIIYSSVWFQVFDPDWKIVSVCALGESRCQSLLPPPHPETISSSSFMLLLFCYSFSVVIAEWKHHTESLRPTSFKCYFFFFVFFESLFYYSSTTLWWE